MGFDMAWQTLQTTRTLGQEWISVSHGLLRLTETAERRYMGKSVRYRGIDLHSGRRGWGMGLSLLAPFHLIRLLVEVELMVAAEK